MIMIAFLRTPFGLGIVLLLSLGVLYIEHQAAIPRELFGRRLEQNAALPFGLPRTAALSAVFARDTAPAFNLVGESVPLSMAGDVGYNVRAALNANGGALRAITIQPGETWSFNASVGSPAHVDVRVVAGIPGGGWCDLASRYVQALRPVLPAEAIVFPNHVRTAGIGLLDVADEDAVAIWNIDGRPGSFGGRQDLEVTNTLAVPLQLQVIEGPTPDTIVVRALEVR